VIEKTVEVEKDTSPEIISLRDKVSALETIVSKVKDGKDGRDGRDGRDGEDGAAGKDGIDCVAVPEKVEKLFTRKIRTRFHFVDNGNQTIIIKDIENDYSTEIISPPAPNERDVRKLFAIVGSVFAMVAVNRFMEAPLKMKRNYKGTSWMVKRTPIKTPLLIGLATVVVNYGAHKFVNKKLTAAEIVTDVKDFSTGAANTVKNIVWETPRDAVKFVYKWRWELLENCLRNIAYLVAGARDGVKYVWNAISNCPTKIRNKWKGLKEEIG
jgi:hypothetical protein